MSSLSNALSGLFKLAKADPVSTLIREIDKREARMFRIFREGLGCRDRDIRGMEITYFAAASTTYVYQDVSRDPERKEHAGQVVRMVLDDSVAAFDEELSSSQALREYQKRYSEHGNLLKVLLDPDQKISQKPAISLLYHLYACVTGQNPHGHMKEIEPAAELVAKQILEQAEFVKKRL